MTTPEPIQRVRICGIDLSIATLTLFLLRLWVANIIAGVLVVAVVGVAGIGLALALSVIGALLS